MGKPSVGISDDYATASNNGTSFYFGYEKTTEDGEWCFSANFGEVEIVIPESKLGCKGEPVEIQMLQGIMWLFSKYRLEPIVPPENQND